MATGILIEGTDGDDPLEGGSGDDTLVGGLGNDTLSGLGGGIDLLQGGLGDDVYRVGPGDIVTELAGEGYDVAISHVNLTLADHVEQLELIGAAATGIGNSLDNVLVGNSGANALDGRAGADTMRGGAGDDDYTVDSTSDRVVEEDGGGYDRVFASANFTLGNHVEELRLTGTADLRGNGNGLDNYIKGNDGANVLDGKAGADTMVGGAGGDTYYVDNVGDRIMGEASGASGTDRVVSSISWVLKGYVEDLRLTGTADLDGTGNALHNVLQGNSGANRLDGRSGNDTLIGGAGNDTLTGLGGGVDVLKGGSGDDVYHTGWRDEVVEAANGGYDTVVTSSSWTLADNVEQLELTGSATSGKGNALDNVLVGTAFANRLDGKAGADTLRGGDGDDHYTVDSSADRVVESAGAAGGYDVVVASANFTLGSHVEELQLAGAAHLRGTGNAQANLIEGNSGNNVLDGKGGADTLVGGAGNDTYYVDTAADRVMGESSAASGGVDKIVSSVSWALKGYVENLTLVGSGMSYGLGNGLDNLLQGSAGMNALVAKNGNDTLDGGAGQDGLLGGAGNDVFRFTSVNHSKGTASDAIGDFLRGADRIDVSALDANAALDGRQDFDFIGSAAFGADATGQLRYQRVPQAQLDGVIAQVEEILSGAGLDYDIPPLDAVLLLGSTDSDADAEFAVLVVGGGVTALAASDLIL